MNLGGDKALLERETTTGGICAVYVCTLVLTCVLNQNAGAESRGFLHLGAHEWRQTPQATGSKLRGKGSRGFKGTPVVLLTLRPLELKGIEH